MGLAHFDRNLGLADSADEEGLDGAEKKGAGLGENPNLLSSLSQIWCVLCCRVLSLDPFSHGEGSGHSLTRGLYGEIFFNLKLFF